MDDLTIIGFMIALFSLNYGGMYLMYNKINSFSTALRILCREHRENHGGDMIECG